MKEIKDFSKKIWNDIINFQWSGWNISIKDSNYLYIKSSWYSILDIYEKDALSKIGIKSFYNDLKNFKSIQEDELNQIIQKNNYSNKKSSIETWFHIAIKSKYVVHVHNIYLNVLLCSKKGIEILEKLFWNDFTYIKYLSPWLKLFQEIKNTKNIKNVIFLANHWLICHSNNSFDEIYGKIQSIQNCIKEYLELKDFSIVNNLDKLSNYLFPDIILMQEDNLIHSTQIYIENEIQRLDLQLNYMKKEDVEYIKNMSSEKYRKSLFNKSFIWS